MNAAQIINLVIFLLAALIMIGIGISNLRSKSPVGFYSGERPPGEDELTDVRAWNRKHGRMWILYGVVIVISAGIGSMAGDSLWSVLPYCGGLLIPIPIMICYHNKLIKRYKRLDEIKKKRYNYKK